jgi:hypothetical protein
LKDAIEAARNFIAACSDPIAKKIEGRDYQRIGGEPYVVTIAPVRGFDWELRPKHFDSLQISRLGIFMVIFVAICLAIR